MAGPAAPLRPRWDIFCRVIDNLGDAGVCWRLAADLATRGVAVRLVIDDARPLAFMAPDGAAGVEVLAWPGPAAPGDVVIEAFGCDPPQAYVAAMAASRTPPVWLNLEYLSAEGYVERSHGLPSPQRNGLMKWFFYPGFTPRTGGLLREAGLLAQRESFDRHAWLGAQGLAPRPGERVVSLFCYDNPALPALLAALAQEPTLLLLTPGPAQEQVQVQVQVQGQARAQAVLPGLRLQRLPWLTQPDFDRLLWSCDLNFVRGEDSLVRALWAGAPFVWQIYPQHDLVHHHKLEALLQRMAATPEVAALWRAWNGNGPLPSALPPLAPWRQALQPWRDALLAEPDLATQLLAFVHGMSATPCC
jgi:uncharacterized repeat protein (TIGR03837 family)